MLPAMRQARGLSLLGALALLVLAGGAPLAADSSITRERVVTKLADGVYEIRHQDPLYGWVNGNTTVVVGSREALVVDACSVAWAAREDIAEIRRWTDRPVRYLLNTHWHHDHSAGNRDYLEAFPGLAIVAHVDTRRMLDATSPHVPAQVLAQAAEARARYEKQLATGKGDDGKPLSPQGRTLAEQQLAALPAVVADAKSWIYQAPTLTFERELVIDLGGREVRIAHLGRGNTGGDAIAYLPKEKILIAGDLVVHPVPYTFDGYPAEWIQTLDRLAALDAETIVPGHGEVLHDKKYVHQLRDLMASVVRQVEAALAANPDVALDEVKKKVDVAASRDAILGDDRRDAPFFDYAMGSLVELAYHEAKQR